MTGTWLKRWTLIAADRFQREFKLKFSVTWGELIGPTVKHEWNDAKHAFHNFLGCDVNTTTAFHLARYSIHLLLLKISMRRLSLRCKEPEIWAVVVAQFAEHLLSLTTFKKCLLGRSRSYFCELFFWWISDQQ